MDAIRTALEKVGIFRGEILTPPDFAALRGTGRASELEGWGFAAPVTSATAEVFLSAAARALSVGLFQSPIGVTFLCLTLQVAGAQVRLVVDLADSRIRRLLSWSAEHRKLKFILSARGTEPRLHVVSVNHAHLESLLEHAKTLRPVRPTHHAVALAAAASELAAPQYVDSLKDGVEVTDVSVCTIAPNTEEILAMASPETATTVH